MPDFIRGQRWINDARLEMGLGSVVATDRRTVTLIFHAAEETLTYASKNAPLTRVRFARDDHITGNDGTSLKIESVKERDGLLIQQQGRALAPEIISSAHQQAHTALNREIHRLQALSQINPSVRPEEIQFFEQQLEAITAILESASLRLEAVRMLVAI